ncbi:hypothetical protein D3C77_731900 [compost metagenome]
MRQIADRATVGHPCATFQGVQVALQRLQLEAVVDVVHPTLQAGGNAFHDVEAFVEEDLDQLRIGFVVQVLGYHR